MHPTPRWAGEAAARPDSDAGAAQAVDVAGVDLAKIMAALGAVVQVWFQAVVALWRRD